MIVQTYIDNSNSIIQSLYFSNVIEYGGMTIYTKFPNNYNVLEQLQLQTSIQLQSDIRYTCIIGVCSPILGSRLVIFEYYI